MKTKVINFFGAPGAGKSTHAAALFAHLKRKGVNCELVSEYAKAVTWRKAQSILDDQLYIFAKQYNYQHRLIDQVDYIITDSPLILSIYYGTKEEECFRDLVVNKWNKFDNINFYVTRTKEYNPIGRNQTAEESNGIAMALCELLINERINYYSVTSDTSVEEIYNKVVATVPSQHAYYLPGMK